MKFDYHNFFIFSNLVDFLNGLSENQQKLSHIVYAQRTSLYILVYPIEEKQNG